MSCRKISAGVRVLSCAPAWGIEPNSLAIANHGGAGVIERVQMTPQGERAGRRAIAADPTGSDH